MASSGNFCTLNPIGQSGGSDSTQKIYENGNLQARDFRYFDATVMGTIGVTSGKWYYEVTLESSSSSSGQAWGWVNSRFNIDAAVGYTSPSSQAGADTMFIYADGSPMKVSSGTHDGSNSNFGSTSANFATTNIIGIAVDFDNSKAYFSQNGSFTNVRSGQNPATAANPCLAPSGGLYAWNLTAANVKKYGPWYPAIGNWASATRTVRVNFGQDSTFQGQVSAGGNADENGFGDFKYSVPAGFLAICSGNLSVSSDIDPAQTDDDYPAKNFNVVLFNGNGSTNAVTGLGFKPDLIWGFTRSASQDKRMVDSTRGGSERVHSNLSNAASTGTVVISAFGSDGFTANGGQFNNDNNATCGAWCWRANGGVTANNTNGTIASVTQANVKAGFSIITYTGSGSNATIGHGLSAAPDFFMVKDRARAESWNVYHSSIGATKYLVLDTSAQAATNSNRWNDTEPDATKIGLGTNDNTNGSSTYVCYAWHNVEGYQRFGNYIGNGSVYGPFIYTGFRPRLLAIKAFSSNYSEGWIVHDTARTTGNTSIRKLGWDNGTGESTAAASHQIDFLSTGFKLRNTNTDINESGSSYIYMAWGDVPTRYNNTF